MSFSEQNRIKELTEKVVNIVARHLGQDGNFNLFLFGSRAKGTCQKGADIDLALELLSSKHKFRDIADDVDRIDTLYRIDLVDLNNVDDKFREIINQGGKKIGAHGK